MKNKKTRPKPFKFFMQFPKIAKQLGIKQIALGGGEPSMFPDFIEEFSKECKKHKVIVNMTTNGDNITKDNIKKFKNITLISFSFDRFKILSLDDIKTLFKKIDLVKKNKIKTGINLQLDPYLIKHLYPMLGEMFKHADYVYLLQSKPSNLKLDKNLRIRLLGARKLFKKVYVDDSLRMCLGFSKSCHRGRQIVSIDFSGNVYKCSFDKPFVKLKKPQDLINIVKKQYPFEKTCECPFI